MRALRRPDPRPRPANGAPLSAPAARAPLFDAHLHIVDPAFPLIPNDGFVPEPFPVDAYRTRVASLDVRGATTVGGYFRAELSNVNPQAIGAIIVGATNPGLPLGICACTQQAGLDVVEVNNFFQLQVPVVASLAGLQLYVQGLELDIGLTPQPCNVGIGFSLTNGFRYELNFN